MNNHYVIETKYKGYKFRSRTEARWAVFFDAMGYKWEYEKEGYQLPDGTAYLPDFYLPEIKLFAEVKGAEFTEEEERKCNLLSEDGNRVVLLDGQPDEKIYRFFENGGEISSGFFIPKGCKYYPIYWGSFWDTGDIIECINKSRAARFEFL